jgi:hypothetical protein
MSEEMRKDFSKEYYRLTGCEVLFDDYGTPYIGGISGVIVNASVQSAWWGWKKSREATKPIKLPNLPSVHDGYTKHEIDFMSYAIDECKEAIKQAGYKVEE